MNGAREELRWRRRSHEPDRRRAANGSIRPNANKVDACRTAGSLFVISTLSGSLGSLRARSALDGVTVQQRG